MLAAWSSADVSSLLGSPGARRALTDLFVGVTDEHGPLRLEAAAAGAIAALPSLRRLRFLCDIRSLEPAARRSFELKLGALEFKLKLI
eukprot:tig00000057_g57.t1